MLRYILVILSFVFAPLGFSETEVAALFGDGMVLQRNEAVSIWGKDVPGRKVKAVGTWGSVAETMTDAEGNWRLEIQTPDAGGPYSLRVRGSRTLVLKNVFIGEVWLCSGQSNMEMPVAGFNNQPVNGSQEAILNSSGDRIRVFTVARNTSLSPVDEVEGEWVSSGPGQVGRFSAVAYFFGKKLEEIVDVPIGLIVTSWGGSSAEAWTDRETLSELGLMKSPIELNESRIQVTPTALYNAMMYPVIGYDIRGLIWYQGEANRMRADEYEALIGGMVRSWREKWGQGDFPFYYAQIAPYRYNKTANSAFLREAQLKTMQSLGNCGMAVTLDIGDFNYIHPSEKKTVGDRLAYWALAKNYGVKGIEYESPRVTRMDIGEEGEVTLVFGPSTSGISSFGKELTGFTIAGGDRIFHPAKAKIGKKKGVLVVSSDEVSEPVAVRYAFENWAEATLFSVSGLPVSSFRTDSWVE